MIIAPLVLIIEINIIKSSFNYYLNYSYRDFPSILESTVINDKIYFKNIKFVTNLFKDISFKKLSTFYSIKTTLIYKDNLTFHCYF